VFVSVRLRSFPWRAVAGDWLPKEAWSGAHVKR
jgi:hypothetical protein